MDSSNVDKVREAGLVLADELPREARARLEALAADEVEFLIGILGKVTGEDECGPKLHYNGFQPGAGPSEEY